MRLSQVLFPATGSDVSFPGSLCVCVSSHLCEYVCMCVNMYVCIWGVYICVYVGVNMCARVYMVYIHVRIYTNVYIHACVHICVCVWSVCVYMCVISVCIWWMRVYMHVYILECVCVHACVCIRVHTHVRLCVYAYMCVRVHVCVCLCTEQLAAETPFSSFPTRGKIKWTLMSLLGPRSYNPPGECCVLHPYSLFFSGRLCQLNKKQIHSAHAKIKKAKKGILQLQR